MIIGIKVAIIGLILFLSAFLVIKTEDDPPEIIKMIVIISWFCGIAAFIVGTIYAVCAY